jgi:hypothetical protein
MVGNRLDVPCTGIGESPCNQARGVSAILLLNQAAVQAVIVQSVHATPSALLGIEEQALAEIHIGDFESLPGLWSCCARRIPPAAGVLRFPVDAL